MRPRQARLRQQAAISQKKASSRYSFTRRPSPQNDDEQRDQSQIFEAVIQRDRMAKSLDAGKADLGAHASP